MSRGYVGRHERRPELTTDRDTVRRQTAARVQTMHTGRHRAPVAPSI